MRDKILISGRIKKDGITDKGYIIADKESGIIEEYGHGGKSKFEGNKYIYDDGFLIEAGDFNAHSHPEQSIYTDIVDKSWDLPTWCRNTIYKYSPILEPKHIYFACCRAFSRMLLLGDSSVMVSFYCHNKRGNEFDKEVIRAAKDTGIRLYFGRMNYDIINYDAYEAKKNSQMFYYETPDKAEENYVKLLYETNDKNVVVAPSIHSMHASTKEAIIRGINLGNKYNRFVQFHLSEDKGDVNLSLKVYNKRPVEFLVELLKSREVKSLENLVLSDCVWIDANERRLIKEYGMKVVLNPRMNDRIKAGRAEIKELLANGIVPYLGTDGEASNDDLSITGEKNFLIEKNKDIPVDVISSFGKAPFKFNEGYIGDIEKGFYCDIKVTKDGLVKDTFVGGKRVVKDGILVNLVYENDIEIPLKKLVREDFSI